MNVNITYNKQNYVIDLKNSFDISIPYNFDGKQPNFFNVKQGQLKYFQSRGNIYSVEAGAGCNVSEVSINIHCTGTHTECVGHLLKNLGDVGALLREALIPAILITIQK